MYQEDDLEELENVFIPMSDGVRLAARIWRPRSSQLEPVPAILEIIPYRKRDETVARDGSLHPFVAAQGYACVRADLRGSGDSEGFLGDEYDAQEHKDCLEVIDWLSKQDWCDGAVGMIGISWSGFNALQVASLRPPALRAVIAVAATDNRFTDDIHFMGGGLLMTNLTWSQRMLADLSRPPDPEIAGDRWRQMWLERLDRPKLFIEDWLSHQAYDDFWRHGSVCEDYAAIQCPVLAVAGWADSYVNFVPRLLSGLRCPRKGIVGPWAHHYPHLGHPGPAIDFLGECVRWWDHWLKGRATDLESEPDWRVYVQEAVPASPSHGYRPGRWVGVEVWTPERQTRLALHLGEGSLTREPSPPARPLLDTPQTLGAASGEWCPYAIGDMPGDQRADDALALRFETAPLLEPVEILGEPWCDLTLVGGAGGGLVVARLEDVAPDGSSTRVTYGVLNLRALEPDADAGVSIRLRLTQTAYRFRPGHRIRLALSSTYWPMLWPSSETPRHRVATERSRLELPLLDGVRLAPRPVIFDPPRIPVSDSVEVIREARYSRERRQNLVTGDEVIEMVADSGRRRFRPHGLELEGSCRELYTIRPDDPLSAQLDIQWQTEVARGEWSARTETATTMRATAEAFLVDCELRAFEGDSLVLERNYSVAVKRERV